MNKIAMVARRFAMWLFMGWIIAIGVAQALHLLQFVRSASAVSWTSVGSASSFDILYPRHDALYISYRPGGHAPPGYVDATEGSLSVPHVSMIRWLEVRGEDQEPVRVRKLMWPTVTHGAFIPLSEVPSLKSESALFYRAGGLRELHEHYVTDGMSPRIEKLWSGRAADKSMFADIKTGWDSRQWFVVSSDCKQIGVQSLVRSGWPVRMVQSSRINLFHAAERIDSRTPGAADALQSISMSGGIVFNVFSPPMNHPGLHPLGEFAIPLRVMVGGSVLNAVCFAIIGVVLVKVPRVLLRLCRHKRGMCLTCGYDLRGDCGAICPECGAETVRRKVRPR